MINLRSEIGTVYLGQRQGRRLRPDHATGVHPAEPVQGPLTTSACRPRPSWNRSRPPLQRGEDLRPFVGGPFLRAGQGEGLWGTMPGPCRKQLTEDTAKLQRLEPILRPQPREDPGNQATDPAERAVAPRPLAIGFRSRAGRRHAALGERSSWRPPARNTSGPRARNASPRPVSTRPSPRPSP